MGLLQDGVWVDKWYDTEATGGKFVRQQSSFRNWVTAEGAAGPSGTGGFKAEAGRYHLYVSHACPWANRTMIFRAIKGLEDIITVSVVHWYMDKDGWTFDPAEGVIDDPIFGAKFLWQVYVAADEQYNGRVTVPVLWDKKTNTIVSNESSEIIRMFNCAFDGVGAKEGDYYPFELRKEIDELNTRLYSSINNGVYKAGFATRQSIYERAVENLFETLEWVEEKLGKSRYLTGKTITEADWRLFTTLVRFDPVYVGHFKCNIKRIADFPNISGYVRELFQHPGVAGTVHFDHIKRHYYESHKTINPTQIVPVGPEVDFNAAHGRKAL
ncbi:Glutathione S-transferase, omega [hydrothermal vent metagenome]|uniref:Glutathione S-transferase, omega n=1 Tax=hydrothermal vent metagenome TaxID=652676 RepID=A0A3B0USP1_9ZZZZ